MTCTALDQCHAAGTCNPATGACSNPAKPNGTRLQRRQRLHADRHLPGRRLHRVEPGDVHGARPVPRRRHLQPGDGHVLEPGQAPNGTACNDGNACTQTDTCQAGVCTGAQPGDVHGVRPVPRGGHLQPGDGRVLQPRGDARRDLLGGNACKVGTCRAAGVCQGSPTCPRGRRAPTAIRATGPSSATARGAASPGRRSSTARAAAATCARRARCAAGSASPRRGDAGRDVVRRREPVQGGRDVPRGDCNASANDGISCSDGDACNGVETCHAGRLRAWDARRRRSSPPGDRAGATSAIRSRGAHPGDVLADQPDGPHGSRRRRRTSSSPSSPGAVIDPGASACCEAPSSTRAGQPAAQRDRLHRRRRGAGRGPDAASTGTSTSRERRRHAARALREDGLPDRGAHGRGAMEGVRGLPDVVLTRLDPAVTPVTVDAGSFQVARGSLVQDAGRGAAGHGPVPAGHGRGRWSSPDGSAGARHQPAQRPGDRAHGRADGPKAMPADLPATLRATRTRVELSADEVAAAAPTGCVFIDAATPTAAPDRPRLRRELRRLPGERDGARRAYYDRTSWRVGPLGQRARRPDPLRSAAGTPTLATTLVAGGHPDARRRRRAGLGVTAGELAELAGLYVPGQTLWRVPVTHFDLLGLQLARRSAAGRLPAATTSRPVRVPRRGPYLPTPGDACRDGSGRSSAERRCSASDPGRRDAVPAPLRERSRPRSPRAVHARHPPRRRARSPRACAASS